MTADVTKLDLLSYGRPQEMFVRFSALFDGLVRRWLSE
jgi:hypothetical protein